MLARTVGELLDLLKGYPQNTPLYNVVKVDSVECHKLFQSFVLHHGKEFGCCKQVGHPKEYYPIVKTCSVHKPGQY